MNELRTVLYCALKSGTSISIRPNHATEIDMFCFVIVVYK
jgi:hypothetical protein